MHVLEVASYVLLCMPERNLSSQYQREIHVGLSLSLKIFWTSGEASVIVYLSMYRLMNSRSGGAICSHAKDNSYRVPDDRERF